MRLQSLFKKQSTVKQLKKIKVKKTIFYKIAIRKTTNWKNENRSVLRKFMEQIK